MGRRQDLHWCTCRTLALGFASERSALLRDLRRVRGRRRAILHTDRPHRAAQTLGNGAAHSLSEEVLLDFPELVVVAGHVGFPWLDELLTLTVKFHNSHVDTPAYVLHRLPPAFV